MSPADRRRPRRSVVLGAGALAMLMAAAAAATELRGRVEGQNQFSSIPTPVNGASVELLDGNGRQVLARYVTGPDGLYYFRGVQPGNYQLRAGGRSYPLAVQQRPTQDIGPIRLKL